MSNIEQKNGPKDIFSVYEENLIKLFSGIKHSVPHYHQSITNIQQEYLQAYESVIDSTITLQKEYAKKIGIMTDISKSDEQAICKTTDEFVKVASIQNEMTLATIDAAQQNIRTFNENLRSYADLNRNILKSWISAFNPKIN
ncbi:MAG: hypothetical protein CK527_07020 [Nitrosarchaeum sp.]|nr:MAG: hypothetical protein CK527_07020 [Nitrosarchaeum sp.]